MKNAHKLFLLALFSLGFINIHSETSVIVDYSKISSVELDTAFIINVKKNDFKKVQELIQAGANVNTLIPYEWSDGDCDWRVETSAFIYAVRHNCPHMIKTLLKVKNKFNDFFTKAFYEAIQKGYLEVIKELIEGGADVNCFINDFQDTPLILAVENEKRAIIQILLKAGARIDSVNKDGNTALMKAVKQHDLNTVLDLLKIPAMNNGDLFFGFFGTKPINYADQDGNTALMLAIKNVRSWYITEKEYNICKDSQKIIEVLLNYPGIDLYHVNNKGETAITLLNNLNKEMSNKK